MISDRYKMDIQLAEGSHLLLTTQSSTKVYKTLQQPVYQETEFRLDNGSFLEYLPDALIAYEQQAGLSMLTIPGFALRVLASTTQEIERVFSACQRMVRNEWFAKEAVPLRKY